MATESQRTSVAAEQFASYIAQQIRLVAELHTGGPTGLYQKILFATLLDSMSRTVYPSRGNRDRFVSFLKSFASWEDGGRVSLPHLSQLLAKVPDPKFSRVRTFANQEMDKWASGEINPLNRDPQFEDIRKLWPVEKEHRFPIENVELESLQHWQLAYTYRNSLVHEFRTLGRGPEIRETGDPYYISVSSLERDPDGELVEGASHWELVYTVEFFRNLCSSSLDNLIKYLIENRLDPYSVFQFGSYWITELN